MEAIKANYEEAGLKAYIIPIGASNGIGNFGYYNAYQEILHQEVEMNTNFDAIVCTVGSGGTYSGLFLGNHFNAYRKKLIGYSVGGSSASFIEQSKKILSDSNDLLSRLSEGRYETFADSHTIVDDFQGGGYAQTSIEDIDFIKYVAELEGLILDPVYTGKAFKGMMTQIKEGMYDDCTNILFIHTGGIFGLEAFEGWFK
jgi:D-cysteine desulfhydrase